MRSVFAGLHSSKKRGGLDEAPQFASRMHVRRDGAMFLKANLARCKKKAGGRGGGEGGGWGGAPPQLANTNTTSLSWVLKGFIWVLVYSVCITGSERVHKGSVLLT